MPLKTKKIALIGTRGVPARYGGFETCAEELGKRLVRRGHDIWVYGRSSYYPSKPKTYLGMKLIFLPGLKIKSLETLSHTFFALCHASLRTFDALLIFNSANSPLLLLPKLLGKKTILHLDGLEWKRGKWNTLGKKYYKSVENLATKLGVPLIADSKEIQKYYKKKYRKDTYFIPYGAEIQSSINPSLLESCGLKPQDYFLQVTRFEPENNTLLLLKAYEQLNTDKKLVLVGGTKYKSPYTRKISQINDGRIKFLGFIYDKNVLRELFCNSFSYIHGNEVGGTNPALLQAMASGCFVICRDVPFNREVLQDGGLYFKKNVKDLRNQMEWALKHPENTHTKRQKARQIIQTRYQWESVVNKYEKVLIQ